MPERPDPEFASLRETLRSPLVADALDGLGYRNQALGPGLAALEPDTVLIGNAFPVETVAADAVPEVPYVGLLAALDAVGSDDVFVISSGGAPGAALWGELLSTACVAAGAAGVVCDGYVRDTAAVRRLGFACFSRGTVPTDINGRFEVVSHGGPLVVDGIAIRRGDLVVADADGVVVVPGEVRESAIAAALDKATRESLFRAAVADGMKPSEAFERFGVL